MSPDQLLLIRHNLNIGCRLLKPSPAARDSFKAGLLSLLQPIAKREGKEEPGKYLANILRRTCFFPEEEAIQENSSPVCYANAGNLRPGFEETAFPDLVAPPGLPNRTQADPLLLPPLSESADLKTVMEATLACIRKILHDYDPGWPTDARLGKRINDLVYSLFGLSGEHMMKDTEGCQEP